MSEAKAFKYFTCLTVWTSMAEGMGYQQNEFSGVKYLSESVGVPRNYQSATIPPNARDNGMHVWVDIVVHSIHVNDKAGSIQVESSIELSWHDSRIFVNSSHFEGYWNHEKVIRSDQISEIWNPDITIHRMLEFRRISLMNPTNGYLKLFLDDFRKDEWNVYYRFDGQVSIYCDFTFERYPMDKQQCNFRLGSYSYEKYLIFVLDKWSEHYVQQKKIDNAGFETELHFFDKSVCDQEKDLYIKPQCGQMGWNDTLFGRLGFVVTMKRNLQPFLMRYYLPSSAIVVLSSASFLVSPDVVPGRMGLLVTMFLTLTNICMNQKVFTYCVRKHTALNTQAV